MTATPNNKALLTASKLNKTVQVGEQKLSIIKDVDIYTTWASLWSLWVNLAPVNLPC